MNVLDHAIDLAARGIAVFPMIAAEKRPACTHGVKDATRDPDMLRRWFVRPGLVPAIATGVPSGISVLDIDAPAGLPWWSDNRDRLPETFAYRTRSGGLHLWFRHSPGLKSSVAVIAPGIDVRSTGASAIYWPAADLPILSDAPPADWPAWLMPPPKPVWTPPVAPPWQGDDVAGRRYGEAALRRAIERVAGAGPGKRNDALNHECFSLMRLTATGALHPGEIAEGLAHAALAAGLDRREIEATLRSALSARGGR